MLIALLPVNLGDTQHASQSDGNGDGPSFIAMALGCDGVHWSHMTQLVSTVGDQGRTWDHPVDGILLEGGEASFLVNENVDNIAPNTAQRRIVRYTFDTAALAEMTRDARRQTPGCHP